MNTYRITLSDRKNARTIKAEDAHAAVCAAVGQRLYSASNDSHEVNRQGKVTAYTFQLNIRNGRTMPGQGVPVVQRWAKAVPL